MTRLLIHQAAWRPIAGALAAYGPALETLVMDDVGVITLGGEVVENGAANPDAAWLTSSLFSSPAVRPFVVELLKSPDLKWVQSVAAGFDHPMFAQIVAKGARLSNSHAHAGPIADYVLAGVLDHFQGGPSRRDAQTRGVWEELPACEIAGTRWLIVGFGAIGQAVAARARAFGAEIVGVRRGRAPGPLAERTVVLGDVHAELPAADVVVLSAPLNADTRQIADARFFAAMKSGAVLVNVGRGGLVNEPDLLAALDRGVPAHAVLDVFETEPLAAESPFWRHPRVSLTAHSASETGEAGEVARRNEALFLDSLRRYQAGEPVLNLVDPADVLAAR